MRWTPFKVAMDELGEHLEVQDDQGYIRIEEPIEEPLSLERPPCLKTCGTQYRGCDPKCVCRLMDEHEELREKFTEAGALFLKMRQVM